MNSRRLMASSPCRGSHLTNNVARELRCASQQNRVADVSDGSLADIVPAIPNVRFTRESGHRQMPLSRQLSAIFGLMHRNIRRARVAIVYSIVSSAIASNVGGTSNPRDNAVLRLIANSNFVGCSTGRSAGRTPLSILSVYVAARRKRSG